jgi:hypothetical protein
MCEISRNHNLAQDMLTIVWDVSFCAIEHVEHVKGVNRSASFAEDSV